MRSRALQAVVLGVALAGCTDPNIADQSADQHQQTAPIELELDEFGFDPAKHPMDAAEQRGLRNVFGGASFRMLVPEELFTKLVTFEPQRQWKVYGNPPSPASRAFLWPEDGATDARALDGRGVTTSGRDVGLGFAVAEQDGKRYMSFTCFECHAGVVAGMNVAGLPNTGVDQVALSKNLDDYARIRAFYKDGLSGLGQGLVQLLAGLDDDDIEHLMQFSLYAETVLNPQISQARSRGENWGVFPVWQLLARLRDPAGAGFDLFDIDASDPDLERREELLRETPLGPVDSRPWWVRKHDTKSYVYGDTLTEPRAGKDFAINFTVPHAGHNETYAERSRQIADVLAFALGTESPPYPYDAFDPRAEDASIEEGREIYNESCSRCHGRVVTGAGKRWRLLYKSQPYAGEHDFWKDTCLPDVLYSTDRDGEGDAVDDEWTTDTDLVYSCALMRFNALADYASGIRPFFAQPEFGIEEDWLPAVYNPQKPGYRAPPLVGIWASAPYLHNGSLPTLGDLFQHESLFDDAGGTPRPAGWSRVLEVSKDLSYDPTMVGMQVEPYFAKSDFPVDPGLDYDFVQQVDYRRFYDTTVPGKLAVGADTCGGRLDQKNRGEKDLVIAFLKELTDDNVETDPSECPHPPKPRDPSATYGIDNLKDHPVCKSFYDQIGVATY